jgi:hypothetical protein
MNPLCTLGVFSYKKISQSTKGFLELGDDILRGVLDRSSQTVESLLIKDFVLPKNPPCILGVFLDKNVSYPPKVSSDFVIT